MFERFSDSARRTVVLAQEESRLLGHSYIDTVHLLLGLTDVAEEPVASVFRDADIDLAWLRSAAREMLPAVGQSEGRQIPFTPGAKRALELSLRAALELGDDHIGTEHLLLGITRLPSDDGAVQMLVRKAGDVNELRLKLIEKTRDPSHVGPSPRSVVGRLSVGQPAMSEPSREQIERLTAQIERLEQQIGRLADLLERDLRRRGDETG